MPFRVVIPARHASTRLPGKPLADIGGRPMLAHVYRRAVASGADEVIVATDDERIAAAARAFGAAVETTSAAHESGTDRLAEVAVRRGWPDDAIVINVQGDEPLIPPANIRQVAELLAADPAAGIATLATPVTSLGEFLDPDVVKVVWSDGGRALYFSRAPIPWSREGAGAGFASQREFAGAWRHIGLYAYRGGALRRFAAAPVAALERIERLEQLRALELGLVIVVAEARELPGPHVDTPEHLAAVRRLMG